MAWPYRPKSSSIFYSLFRSEQTEDNYLYFQITDKVCLQNVSFDPPHHTVRVREVNTTCSCEILTNIGDAKSNISRSRVTGARSIRETGCPSLSTKWRLSGCQTPRSPGTRRASWRVSPTPPCVRWGSSDSDCDGSESVIIPSAACILLTTLPIISRITWASQWPVTSPIFCVKLFQLSNGHIFRPSASWRASSARPRSCSRTSGASVSGSRRGRRGWTRGWTLSGPRRRLTTPASRKYVSVILEWVRDVPVRLLSYWFYCRDISVNKS